MKIELRKTQKEAADKIYEAIANGMRIVQAIIAAGSGKGLTVSAIIERLLAENPGNRILVLFSRRILVEQFIRIFQENCYEDHIANSFQRFNDQRILVTTHQDFSASMKTLDVRLFNVVFCVDADDIKNRIPSELKASKICFVGVFSTKEAEVGTFFYDSPIVAKVVSEAHTFMIREKELTENVVVPMLQNCGFKQITTDQKLQQSTARIDVVARKNEIEYLIEVKAYSEVFPDRAIVNNAIGWIKA